MNWKGECEKLVPQSMIFGFFSVGPDSREDEINQHECAENDERDDC